MTKRAAEQLDDSSSPRPFGPSPTPLPSPPLPPCADVGEMPFADASVDAVHSSAGALLAEPKRGFAEVARVLDPAASS